METNDLNLILSHVYSGAPVIYARARSEFPKYEFKRVKIKNNVDVRFDRNATPPRAEVTFNVVVDVVVKGTGIVEHVPRFVWVVLVMEDNQWRVADYSHDNPQASMFGGRQ